MPLRLSLAPTQASFYPGDMLLATLEVANESTPGSHLAGPIELAGVNVDFSGTERLDRSWVSTSYPPDAAAAPAAREGKREVRQILRTPPARLVMQDYTLRPDESRAWLVRFRLPASLPPSFKGVAARYSYSLTATAQFALPNLAAAAAAGAGPASNAGAPQQAAGEGTAAAAAAAAPDARPTVDSEPSTQGAGDIPEGEPLLSMPSLSLRAAKNARAPRQWQTAETSAVVHLWPYWDPGDRCGSGGAVLAGEDAELAPIPYSAAYPARDLSVDFQELGRGNEGSSAAAGSFSFQRLPGAGAEGPVPLQSALVHSINHRPSVGTPTFAAAAAANDAAARHGLGPAAAPKGSADVEYAVSELTLHSHGESEDAEGTPATARSASARAAGAKQRAGNTLASPALGAGAEAALRSYNLRLGDAALVRVALHSPSEGPLQLGSVLAGTLDFRASHDAAEAAPAAPKCIQVVVLLETEEAVNEPWRSNASARSKHASIRKVWDEHLEVTADLVLSHFMFSLPLDAPASFATHLITLRWVLRFEFTTSVAKPAGWLTGGGTPERVAWSLPVLVCPLAASSS